MNAASTPDPIWSSLHHAHQLQLNRNKTPTPYRDHSPHPSPLPRVLDFITRCILTIIQIKEDPGDMLTSNQIFPFLPFSFSFETSSCQLTITAAPSEASLKCKYRSMGAVKEYASNLLGINRLHVACLQPLAGLEPPSLPGTHTVPVVRSETHSS